MAKYKLDDQAGLLTYLRAVPGRKSEWRCSCGNVVVVNTGDVRSGRTRSCGCVRAQTASDRMKKRHAEKK